MTYQPSRIGTSEDTHTVRFRVTTIPNLNILIQERDMESQHSSMTTVLQSFPLKRPCYQVNPCSVCAVTIL